MTLASTDPSLKFLVVTQDDEVRGAFGAVIEQLRCAQDVREVDLQVQETLEQLADPTALLRVDAIFVDERTLGDEASIKIAGFRAAVFPVSVLMLADDGKTLHGAQDFVSLADLSPDFIWQAARMSRAQKAMGQEIDRQLRRIAINEKSIFDIINRNADGILILSLDGTVLFANPAARDLFQNHDDDFIGSSFGLPMSHGEMIEITLVSGKIVEARFASIVWDGEDSLLASLRDITHHKVLQEELRKAKRTAEEASRHKSDFLARMSHEIRTPLNGIVGMTSLLLEEPLPKKSLSFVETVRTSSESLISVINDILDFSKAEAGKMSLEVLDFDPVVLIEETLGLFSEATKSKRLILADVIGPAVPRKMSGDPGRLRQILSNLIANAVKFTARGRVTIHAHVENPSALRIEVRDTGCGISAEGLALLFEPFSQADTSVTRRYGGTGLGLAICKRLTELMGGKIGVDSEAGRGSTFWVEIPLSSPPAPAKVREPRAPCRLLCMTDDAHLPPILSAQFQTEPTTIDVVSTYLAGFNRIEGAWRDHAPFDGIIIDARQFSSLSSSSAAARAFILASAHLPKIWLSTLGAAPPTGVDRVSVVLELGILSHRTLVRLVDTLPDPDAKALGTLDLQAAVEPRMGRTVTRLPDTAHDELVLVAEDNVVNQRVAVQMLEKLGYRADVVANGREAWEALKSVPYDLVLMDCEMPEMDGYTASRGIRSSGEAYAQIPIIAMTAYAMSGDREKCFEAGMSDYVPKPVKLHELAEVLARWSGGRQAGPVSPRAAPPVANSVLIDEDIVQNLESLGDASLMREIYDLFVETVPRHIELIRAAVRRRDFETIRTRTHALKGSAGNIGASSMMAHAEALETLAREGRTDGAETLLARLEYDFKRVQAHYDGELTNSPSSSMIPRLNQYSRTSPTTS